MSGLQFLAPSSKTLDSDKGFKRNDDEDDEDLAVIDAAANDEDEDDDDADMIQIDDDEGMDVEDDDAIDADVVGNTKDSSQPISSSSSPPPSQIKEEKKTSPSSPLPPLDPLATSSATSVSKLNRSTSSAAGFSAAELTTLFKTVHPKTSVAANSMESTIKALRARVISRIALGKGFVELFCFVCRCTDLIGFVNCKSMIAPHRIVFGDSQHTLLKFVS